jgi:hypothetical protein
MPPDGSGSKLGGGFMSGSRQFRQGAELSNGLSDQRNLRLFGTKSLRGTFWVNAALRLECRSSVEFRASKPTENDATQDSRRFAVL